MDECICCGVTGVASKTAKRTGISRMDQPFLSVFGFSLVPDRTLKYDLDHMMPEPYNLIPPSALRPLTRAAGDKVFRQGARTCGLYVVKCGRVHLERVGPDGERFIIYRAEPGMSLAEASVFSDRYHCDAVVAEAGAFVQIDKAAVLSAFADPDFARAYARQAAQQIQAQRQALEIVGIRRAEERVYAGMVAGLLESSVVDFASALHLSHEATYRALRKLVNDGRIANPTRGTYHLRP